MASKILVLGNGAAGLLAALELLRADHDVIILGEEAPSSQFSYAQCPPVKTADPRVEGWSHATIDHWRHLADSHSTGVTLRTYYKLHGEATKPWFLGTFDGTRSARPDEIPNPLYPAATVLEDFPLINPAVYLPWLREQIVELGGTFVWGKLNNWSDVPHDITGVVNCTGLGGKQLLDDPELGAEWMQVVRIRNQPYGHIRSVYIDDDGPNKLATIIPQDDFLVLGAVLDGPDANTLEQNEANIAIILERTAKMLPGFTPQRYEVASSTRIARPKRATIDHRLVHVPTGDGRTLPVFISRGFHGMTYCVAKSVDEIVETMSNL